MSSKLAERGIYVDEEDLTDAQPEVLEFFLALKEKKSNERGRQSRRRTEAGCKPQQEELGELIRSLTETIRKSMEQDPSPMSTYAGVLSPTIISKIDSFIAAVNALNADLGTSGPVWQPPQEPGKNARRSEGPAEDGESRETSTPIFGRDVVMVDMPAESAEQSPIQGRAQDYEPVVQASRILAPLGTSSAPVNINLLSAEDLGPTALPNPSGSNSDILEELVQFGSKHWPGKNLGCFRPGQLVTGDFLHELLRADLPARYAMEVTPDRVHEMKGRYAGIALFYNVTNATQFPEDENERDHFVIAIVNEQARTFTSWGMSEALSQKWTAAYGKALGFKLANVRHKLRNCTGKCSAFRCVEAIRSYFSVDTTVRNELSLRLYFLKKLLESWIKTTTKVGGSQLPGECVTAVTASSHLPSRDQSGQTLSTTKQNADRPNTARTPLPSTLSSRKRPAMIPASTQRREEDNSGTESVEPPPKRKDKEAPSAKALVKELTGSGAVERIRQQVLACKQDTPVLPKAWDEHGDWAEQTCRYLDLADEWDERSIFSSLVALILRTHGVERIYIEAKRKFKICEDAEDIVLPGDFIDQLSPHLRQKRSPAAFRTWLKGTKNLLRLSAYLPFIPQGTRGTVSVRKYERLANQVIQQVRDLLDDNSRARRLAKVGRAFQDCILKRQSFIWEDISYEDLSKLLDEPLLHLLTIRRDSISKQCDLCDEETCQLFTLDELASRELISPARDHDASERVSSPYTAAHHNTEVLRTRAFETSPPASTALRTADYRPAAPLPPAQTPAAGPQFQLASSRIVSDTDQSISFAMNGNIDGLKFLFTLGLASPNDKSCSRGFSLLRWALYGGHSGMHHYEAVQFLVEQGAHADEELYETVEYYDLSKRYSATDKQALRCLARQETNWFRRQKFPLVHKIVFRMSSKPLKDELSQNPGAVFATDAQGRTALDWATIRAQLDDMELLIAFGSSPNSMDDFGRTTVLHAVDSRDTRALRIILEAGADSEPQIPVHLYRGNPLTSANLNGLPEMVKLLIEFGADIDAANPEGLTALHSAVVSQNPECASILLAHGADAERASSSGYTPIMMAIMHNSHEVLKLLLGRSAVHLNSNILSVIDGLADQETRSMLASASSFDLSGD